MVLRAGRCEACDARPRPRRDRGGRRPVGAGPDQGPGRGRAPVSRSSAAARASASDIARPVS
ncbi:hypothetical protein GB881_02245 [Georgenia subflava]|uniref:Uncharacterized protein n=1 Tax=Georgenia subflava TaxID=1622177 RepID=A0A6N7EBU1_9MICO|nr:hypothetical protein [Georgenia subflava]